MNKPGPGYCVECFIPLERDKCICDRCRAEKSGDIEQNKEENKESSNGKKKND